MALLFNERYQGESKSPTPEYPWGSFQDRSSPTSTDGTKLQQDWSNDFFAFNWALLKHARMVPNGDIDTVENSQYFDALIQVIKDNSQKLEMSDAVNGSRTTVAASEKAVGDLNKLKVNKSGDTMTGNLRIETPLPLVDLRNTNIPANNVGARVVLHNVSGRPVLSTTNDGWTSEVRHEFPSRSGVLALGNTAAGGANGWALDNATGILDQWGSAWRSGNTTRVNFPKPFETQCYNVMITQFTGDTDTTRNITVVSYDRFGFVFHARSNENRIMYRAIGK